MKRALFILLLSGVPLLTGCFGVNDYFRAVRTDIIRNCGVEFSEDTEFSIGPVGLTIAGIFVSEEEDPEAARFISEIKRVQVGVYKKKYDDNKGSYSRVIKNIDKRMKMHGWQYIVKRCEEGELSAVYTKSNPRGGLTRMFVVNIDREELTIMQLDGNLTNIIETAIKERGLENYYH